MLFDLKKEKKGVTIQVDLEALIEEFENGNVKIEELHYLLFDEEIAYKMLNISPITWYYLPNKFKLKKKFALIYSRTNNYYGIYEFFKVIPEMLSDSEIVSNLLRFGNAMYIGEILLIDKELLLSPEFVLKNIEYSKELYTLYDDYFLKNNSGGYLYSDNRMKIDNSNIRSNFEVTLKAVQLYGYTVYQFASNELKDNIEIVKALLEKYPYSYLILNDNFKNNSECIKLALSKNSALFKELDAEKQKCYEYAVIAVRDDVKLFEYVGEGLKTNTEFVNDVLKTKNDEMKISK